MAAFRFPLLYLPGNVVRTDEMHTSEILISINLTTLINLNVYSSVNVIYHSMLRKEKVAVV